MFIFKLHSHYMMYSYEDLGGPRKLHVRCMVYVLLQISVIVWTV